jgi:hypothetical protein
LAYLQDAFEKHRVVNFGGMGSGFEPIDAAQPCVVKSRALLLEDETTAGRCPVISQCD